MPELYIFKSNTTTEIYPSTNLFQAYFEIKEKNEPASGSANMSEWGLEVFSVSQKNVYVYRHWLKKSNQSLGFIVVENGLRYPNISSQLLPFFHEAYEMLSQEIKELVDIYNQNFSLLDASLKLDRFNLLITEVIANEIEKTKTTEVSNAPNFRTQVLLSSNLSDAEYNDYYIKYGAIHIVPNTSNTKARIDNSLDYSYVSLFFSFYQTFNKTKLNWSNDLDQANTKNNKEIELLKSDNQAMLEDLDYLKNQNRKLKAEIGDLQETLDEFQNANMSRNSPIDIDKPYMNERSKINFRPILMLLFAAIVLCSLVFGVYKIVHWHSASKQDALKVPSINNQVVGKIPDQLTKTITDYTNLSPYKLSSTDSLSQLAKKHANSIVLQHQLTDHQKDYISWEGYQSQLKAGFQVARPLFKSGYYQNIKESITQIDEKKLKKEIIKYVSHSPYQRDNTEKLISSCKDRKLVRMLRDHEQDARMYETYTIKCKSGLHVKPPLFRSEYYKRIGEKEEQMQKAQ